MTLAAMVTAVAVTIAVGISVDAILVLVFAEGFVNAVFAFVIADTVIVGIDEGVIAVLLLAAAVFVLADANVAVDAVCCLVIADAVVVSVCKTLTPGIFGGEYGGGGDGDHQHQGQNGDESTIHVLHIVESPLNPYLIKHLPLSHTIRYIGPNPFIYFENF